MSNEHTEQSEREELIRWLDLEAIPHRPGSHSRHMLLKAAALLAADKAGGEVDTGDLAGKHGVMLETGWDEWPKSCDFTPVKRSAVEWFKLYYPSLCLKSGLCEKVGGRLYTISTIQPQPQAVPDDVVKDAERIATQIMDNLDDRRGVLDEIDDEVRSEMHQTIFEMCRAAMLKEGK